MTWITGADLQKRLGGDRARPQDESALRDAALTACKVVETGWVNGAGNRYPGVGPVLTTTITDERVRAGVTTCRVVEIVAIGTLDGKALVPGDYYPEGQLVSRADGGPMPSPVLLTYTTGWGDAPPEWARTAALAIGEQLFARRFKSAGNAEMPIGFLVPRLAEQLLEPYQRAPLGFS